MARGFWWHHVGTFQNKFKKQPYRINLKLKHIHDFRHGEVAKVLFANWLACYSRMWGQIEIQRPLASVRNVGTPQVETTPWESELRPWKIPEILGTTKNESPWKSMPAVSLRFTKKNNESFMEKWHANLLKWAPNYQLFLKASRSYGTDPTTVLYIYIIYYDNIL